MRKEEELELLKKCFKYSVKEVYKTSVVLRGKALENPRVSIMEQIDSFGYTVDDAYKGVDILNDLLNEVIKDRKARNVLGCTDDMSVNEMGRVIDEVRKDIENLFNKLRNNEKDVAATNDDNNRRKDYVRLMKGFRVIASVLKRGNFSPDVVAATLATISESSRHCLGNWKHILIGLMIQFEDQIEHIIGDNCISGKKRVMINGEEDVIYNTIVDAFYSSRKYVAEGIVSDFIGEYIYTYDLEEALYEEGNIAHYKGLCMDYLNDNYYLGIPQLEVEDSFLSDELRQIVTIEFEEYLKDKNIDNLIYDRATDVIMDDIARNPNKIVKLLDWFDKYLQDKNFNEIRKDKDLVIDFFCKYITKGEYNQEIRYLAIREIMLYYDFIVLKPLKDRVIFSEDRIRRVLADLGEEDKEEKRKILTKVKERPGIFINIANDPSFSYDDIWGDEEIRNIIRGFVKNKDALLYACKYKSTDIAKYLIQNGAMLEEKDEEGRTPLFIAYSEGLKDVVNCLLERGGNIKGVDCFGNTLLMLACEENDFEMVRYLVERGVDINAVSFTDGGTALMLACEKNNTEIVKYLVENGADINAESIYKETPLGLACKNDNGEIMTCLVKNFASVLDLRHRENTVKVFEYDFGNERKCRYSMYIQALIVLDDIDWLRQVMGDDVFVETGLTQQARALWLNRFLCSYLNENRITKGELKNCLNFMEKKRNELRYEGYQNEGVIRVLDEYIIVMKKELLEENYQSRLSSRGTNAYLRIENVHNNDVERRGPSL